MQGSQTPQTRRMDAILKRPENKVCFDCGGRQPRWASSNLGIFLCLRCAGFHRALGVHICTIKSTNMDIWDDAMLDVMDRVGNEHGAMLYEARLPHHFRKPDPMSSSADVERAVRMKYGSRDYWNRDYDALYKELVSGSKPIQQPNPPAPSPTTPSTGIVQGRVIPQETQPQWGGFENSKVVKATVIHPVVQQAPPAPVAPPQPVPTPKPTSTLDDFFAVQKPSHQVKPTVTDDDIFGAPVLAKVPTTRSLQDDPFGDMQQSKSVQQQGGFDDFFGGTSSSQKVAQSSPQPRPPPPVAQTQTKGHPNDPFLNALDAFTNVEQKSAPSKPQPSMSELAYSSNIHNPNARAW